MTRLDDIIELAKKHQEMLDALTPEERAEYRKRQIRSLAWGNLECSTFHRISREEFERIMDEMDGVGRD